MCARAFSLIDVWVNGSPALLEAVRTHAEVIRGETLGLALHIGAAAPAPDRQETMEIDGHRTVISVARHPAGEA